MAKESDLQELVGELKTLADSRITSLHTCQFAIIEEIDHQNARVKISHKDDKDVQADEVPILSAYAGDGYGTIEPLKPGDVGVVFFNMNPLKDTLKSEGHHETEKYRLHSMQDPMFFPRTWLDPFEIPEHEEGERLVYHESGTFFSIKPNGDTVIQHVDGNRMRIDSQEGVLEVEDETKRIGVNDQGVKAISDDEEANYVQNPQSEISVNDVGVAKVDGISEIGDQDAKRINREQRDYDGHDPRIFAQVDEDVGPITDPSKNSQTQYDNPSTVENQGPVDAGMYEIRNHVVERREEDPDPTVTNPQDPRYVPLPDDYRQRGELPRGYEYLHTGEGAKKIIGQNSQPVVIKSGI